jgi:hypothetical protein
VALHLVPLQGTIPSNCRPRAKDDMSRQLATPAANCRLYEKENETNIGQ